jgi:hypothetical protein
MSKFYATGTKKVTTNETDENGKLVKVTQDVSVIVNPDPYDFGMTRAQAQNEVNRIAKREKITLDGYGVRVVQGTQRGGDVMTKNAKQRRFKRTLEHQANKRKKA